MAFVPDNNPFHGLYNLITGIEFTLYSKLLNKQDIVLYGDYYTMYLTDIGYNDMQWRIHKRQYGFSQTTIYSTKEVMEIACNKLNNLKESTCDATSLTL